MEEQLTAAIPGEQDSSGAVQHRDSREHKSPGSPKIPGKQDNSGVVEYQDSREHKTPGNTKTPGSIKTPGSKTLVK